ncbi:hypothetical protein IMCC1989_396 [gamma proteobacterium IMCC1989]|nr:hypothetical protein IMCC1989_396 [gamma proteobacterium IMCC1989]
MLFAVDMGKKDEKNAKKNPAVFVKKKLHMLYNKHYRVK